jgi:hypothetical protein
LDTVELTPRALLPDIDGNEILLNIVGYATPKARVYGAPHTTFDGLTPLTPRMFAPPFLGSS